MTTKLTHWLGVLLLIAFGVRVIEWLLRPVTPLLIVALVLVVFYHWLLGRSYR